MELTAILLDASTPNILIAAHTKLALTSENVSSECVHRADSDQPAHLRSLIRISPVCILHRH